MNGRLARLLGPVVGRLLGVRIKQVDARTVVLLHRPGKAHIARKICNGLVADLRDDVEFVTVYGDGSQDIIFKSGKVLEMRERGMD